MDVLTDAIVTGALLDERVLDLISIGLIDTMGKLTYLWTFLGSCTSLGLGEWGWSSLLSGFRRLSLRKEDISECVH